MFVGSSSETEALIRALSLNLDGEVSVKNWATSPWPLSRSTLDGVEEKLKEADFAAFILAPEDAAVIRGELTQVPRDNVLFELGISYGSLGRDRTFILAPKDSDVEARRLPDLLGVTVVEYDLEDDDETAMANPASRLLAEIKKGGLRDRNGGPGALSRGETSRMESLVDGAIQVSESRNRYADELRKAVLRGETVPAKFQFAQPDGGRHWLRLCRSPNYEYFNKAKAHLRESLPSIASSACDATGTAAVDLVSLGCGDGSKDDLLLRTLAAELSDSEHVYYYPVEISDILLVEGLRYISRHGLDRSRFRCKPTLGDFTNLTSLKGIVDYRRNPNLFSILGNTIGSFDEADIFASVAGAMEPGDLVLVELNVGEPADSVDLLRDDVSYQWDLSTLDALEIPRKSCELRQDQRDDLSVVGGTRTLVSYALPEAEPNSQYMLSAMHHYDLGQVKRAIRKELDVSLIAEHTGDGVSLLLAQRRP